MASIRDNIHGIYINIREAIDIFKLPYYNVKIYKNGEIVDVSRKIKKYSIRGINCISNSSYMHVHHYYQLHSKITSKFYVLYTTMYDIINNIDLIPGIENQKPKKLSFPKPQIFINDIPLTLEEQLYFKNHHKDNNLFYSFMFKEIHVKTIVVKKNKKVIKNVDEDITNLTIEEIHEYL